MFSVSTMPTTMSATSSTTSAAAATRRSDDASAELTSTALTPSDLTLTGGSQFLATDLPCQRTETLDLWFAERGEDVERAKSLCHSCPLRAECLDGALRRQEPWGVWGGEVFIDGVVVARKRGRGRPRKVAA